MRRPAPRPASTNCCVPEPLTAAASPPSYVRQHGKGAAPDGAAPGIGSVLVQRGTGPVQDPRHHGADVGTAADRCPGAVPAVRGGRCGRDDRTRWFGRTQCRRAGAWGRTVQVVCLPPERIHRGGAALHPKRHSDVVSSGRADRDGQPDHGAKGAGADGGCHGHRQEHHAGRHAGAPEPTPERPHPHDRGSGGVPVHPQEVGGESA